MPTIKVIFGDSEETVRLYLNMGNGFDDVSYANYDEHGSSGLQLVSDMAYNLARITGWELIEEIE